MTPPLSRHDFKDLESVSAGERYIKLRPLLKSLPLDNKKLLLGCACHWGDVSLTRAILNQEPTWINDPIFVGSLIQSNPFHRLWAQNEPVPPLLHAIRNGKSALTKALLSHPGISTDLVPSGLDKFGWTLLGLVIAHAPARDPKRKLQILEALIKRGEDPLAFAPSDPEESCAINVSINELDLEALQVLCKPPFKWNKIKASQRRKINESLQSQFEYIEHMISFHEDESSINSETMYEWIKALIELEMPPTHYPAFKEQLKHYPDLIIEHEQSKLNQNLPTATQEKNRLSKRL